MVALDASRTRTCCSPASGSVKNARRGWTLTLGGLLRELGETIDCGNRTSLGRPPHSWREGRSGARPQCRTRLPLPESFLGFESRRAKVTHNGNVESLVHEAHALSRHLIQRSSTSDRRDGRCWRTGGRGSRWSRCCSTAIRCPAHEQPSGTTCVRVDPRRERYLSARVLDAQLVLVDGGLAVC